MSKHSTASPALDGDDKVIFDLVRDMIQQLSVLGDRLEYYAHRRSELSRELIHEVESKDA